MHCSAAASAPPPPGASDVPGLEVAGTVDGGPARALRGGTSRRRGVRASRRRRLCPIRPCAAAAGAADAGRTGARSKPRRCRRTFHRVGERLSARPTGRRGNSACARRRERHGFPAIMLGRAFGARALATAGSDRKCEACVRIGAEKAINYKSVDFVAAVTQHTSGRGVDVASYRRPGLRAAQPRRARARRPDRASRDAGTGQACRDRHEHAVAAPATIIGSSLRHRTPDQKGKSPRVCSSTLAEAAGALGDRSARRLDPSAEGRRDGPRIL